MIENLLKKFGGRFKNHLTTYSTNTLLPVYSFEDKVDGERFQIQIDSFAADPEMVIENILNEKIVFKRDNKIKSVLNEK
jgi:hypothetical protein